MKFKSITLPVVLVSAFVVLLLTYTNQLPNDMMGSFALMFILGVIFGEIGDRISFIKNWLGGGPILCIFGPALMIYFKILPEYTIEIMKVFMKETNFFSFFISIMICGAMFSISQKIIVRSSLKFLPAILGGIIVAMGFAGLAGIFTGYGFKEAIYYLAIPIMGGGVGAGALPLSQIYAQSGGIDAAQMLSIVMPAVILGNVGAIFMAVLLNKLGKKHPKLTSNGNIMKIKDEQLLKDIEDEKNTVDNATITFESLGTGFFVAIAAYMIAFSINKFLVPSIHTLVWLILLLTITKAAKILPQRVEISTIQWSRAWVKNLLYAALIPIGIAYMNIAETLEAITQPGYLIIAVVTVIGATLGAGIIGKLCGLFPIESSIAAGLCMANMAQTGDLATLAAADRMDLLPYAAYSSRIGGSIILVLVGLLIGIVGI